MDITVFESSIEKGKLTLYITAGDTVVSSKLTPEAALELADRIRDKAERMPRTRVGTAADLGCAEI